MFGAKAGVRDVQKKGRVLWEVVKVIRNQSLLAVAVAALLIYLDGKCLLSSHGLLGLTLKPDTTLVFLSTLAPVSAAMLGLYFTAISLVASTAYARVSGEIRSLVVGEQVGSFYFFFLTQFAANSLLLLGGLVLGLPVGIWSVVYAVIIGAFGILSFVTLGLRTFNFFDPVKLVEPLNGQLLECLGDVTPAGYRWENNSIQSAHQRRAELVLDCYGNLITMSEQRENLNSHALPDLAAGLIQMLAYNSTIKGRIPSESFWFRRQPKHKDWLTNTQSDLEIARATDTALSPEQIPDKDWFEERAGRHLGRIIASLLGNSDFWGANSVIDRIRFVLNSQAEYLQLGEALKLSAVTASILDKQFHDSKYEDESTEKLDRSSSRMAMFDLQGLGLIHILLGTTKVFRERKPSVIEESANSIDWRDSATLYRGSPIPRNVIVQWESLFSSLGFEIEVEGSLKSPLWLPIEATALGYAQFFSEIDRLIGAIEQCFEGGTKQRLKADDKVGAAQLALRGMEATNKLMSHLPILRKWHGECNSLNVSRDANWPTIDWDSFKVRVEALRKSLVAALASTVGSLAKLPETKAFPDLFGQTYSILADGCFDALLKSDEHTFNALFEPLFAAGFAAHERIRLRQDRRDTGFVKLALSPFGDLLALSGYAILETELTGKHFFDVPKKKWDSYFARLGTSEAKTAVIKLLVTSTDILMGTSPRERLRFNWKSAFNDHLSKQGLKIGRGLYAGDIPDRTHKSAILRAFAMSAGFLCDGEDVFLATHIFAMAEAAGIEKPNSVDSLQHVIRAEEKANGGDDA
jgi:hypothetical protein